MAGGRIPEPSLTNTLASCRDPSLDSCIAETGRQPAEQWPERESGVGPPLVGRNSGESEWGFPWDRLALLLLLFLVRFGAFAEGTFWNNSNAVTWAGFGGFRGDTYLWQAGTEEWTQSAFWFEISGYDAWTQEVPAQSQQQTIANFSVNNGDDIYVEVYMCDPTTNAETPYENNYALCAHVHNYTQNEDVYIPYFFTIFVTGPQNAEAIQERPLNRSGGQNDYAQFNAFNFMSTNVCAIDFLLPNDAVWCNSISPHAGGLIPGPSPFRITMAQIGSPSHKIGQSCIADDNGTCDDSGYFVHVWWDAHN
jgi:hypothetical protein